MWISGCLGFIIILITVVDTAMYFGQAAKKYEYKLPFVFMSVAGGCLVVLEIVWNVFA